MLIPAIKEVFSKYKDALEMQKDLYYASMLSESIVKVIKLDPEGSPCGLQLPQNEDGDIDWFMLCLCISSIFDTAQFLKKYDVFSFSFYSNTMRPIGSYTKLDQVPVIQSFFDDRPKEFFVVASGFFDLYRSARNLRNLHQIQPADRDRSWTFEKWDSILAIVANFGKIIGLSCYRRSAGQMWLAVVGLLGNHAGLFRMMLFHHVARVKRNTCPAPPDL